MDYRKTGNVVRDCEGQLFHHTHALFSFKKDGQHGMAGGQYTVFGAVKEGMDVADRIQSVATDKYDRPLEDIRILSVIVPEEPKAEPKNPPRPKGQTSRGRILPNI